MPLNTNYILSSALHDMLKKHQLKLSFAESCTGGYLCTEFTAVSGASDHVDFSLITYSNDAKIKHLHVKKNIIEENGAVSAQCAIAMAQGLQKIHPVDIALSITGIAGPNGGTTQKPVGTIHIAIADKNLSTSHKHLFLTGGRKNIRRHSVQAALEFIIEHISTTYNDT